MHIHRFEKLWFGVSLLLIVGLIGTIVYGAVGPGVAMVSDEGGTVDASEVANGNYGDIDNFREPGVYQSEDGESIEVYMIARQYLFAPGSSEPVRVPAGVPVTFHVTSPDVTHGFNLAGTNVNAMVVPGQISEFTVTFEEPGEHGIICHEYCGSGHHTMAGKLVVVPQSQYDIAADGEN
ncbi:MAG: cytochrome c oxidase subunit II [Halolamina sp.]|uniref:cytochrome c oxidase subunit II n=1 Tax=Halolamina sp. TaxID=1940283 RepID=UPI002FC3D82D